MSIHSGPFPRKDGDFNNYANLAHAYLRAEAIRLGVTPGNLAIVLAILGPPPTVIGPPPGTNATAGTWNFVYPLESNKATFTHPLKLQKDDLRKQLEKAFGNIYADIADSLITSDDELNLHILSRASHKQRSAEPPQINDLVVISLKGLGGGRIQRSVRTSSDSKTASKFAGADIEYRWVIYESAGDPLPQPPAAPFQCPNSEVATQAISIMELGAENAGKKLALFARWIYTKHPARSGPFSTVQTVVIG